MTDNIPRILIIDDEANICRSCIKILSKEGYDTSYSLDGHEALRLINREDFDIVITDLKMSRLGGMEVLANVKEHFPDTLVIVITGYSTVSSAVEVMKMGAFDYLPKPFTPHELRAVVKQALFDKNARIQNQKLARETKDLKTVSHQLVGNSQKIQKVIKMVEKVAPTDATVLIQGESGTGKELIARAVHANSNRADKVFFAVDCGTLSGSLLESELFGHVKGAFTDAHRDKSGILKRADKGTVFLDEISNISMEVQGQLLRFLETREFMPLGSSVIEKVDIRLIFATNRNLQDMVEQGSFREDFYYRIFVYPVILPPLRERQSDIMPIAYHFLRQFSGRISRKISGFSDEAAARLNGYDWPGNVRQLKNMIERAVILCEGDRIGIRELPHLSEIRAMEQIMETIPDTNEALKQIKKEIRQKAIEGVEKKFLLNALSKNEWNVTKAAKKVGMQRPNFQNLMKKHGIKISDKP